LALIGVDIIEEYRIIFLTSQSLWSARYAGSVAYRTQGRRIGLDKRLASSFIPLLLVA
jgi:hypothetical protein